MLARFLRDWNGAQRDDFGEVLRAFAAHYSLVRNLYHGIRISYEDVSLELGGLFRDRDVR